MSAIVKLAARLPGDIEINGLASISEQLCGEPQDVAMALMWFDVVKVTHDIDSATDVPTVRVRRVEPVGTLAQAPAELHRLAEELFEKRTGRRVLPFDVLVGDDDEDGEQE